MENIWISLLCLMDGVTPLLLGSFKPAVTLVISEGGHILFCYCCEFDISLQMFRFWKQRSDFIDLSSCNTETSSLRQQKQFSENLETTSGVAGEPQQQINVRFILGTKQNSLFQVQSRCKQLKITSRKAHMLVSNSDLFYWNVFLRFSFTVCIFHSAN